MWTPFGQKRNLDFQISLWDEAAIMNGIKGGLLASVFWFLVGNVLAENWPGWGGPRGDGSTLSLRVPTTWSATENGHWKVAVPGVGHSSPMISEWSVAARPNPVNSYGGNG